MSAGYQQDQFLDVIDRDEAERRFHAALDLRPLDAEEVPLDRLLGRVLARDVVAPVDVPSFDRSNVDGYAVRAQDVYGCSEEEPARLAVTADPVVPGSHRRPPAVGPGAAVPIATGAVIPRGADAVVMVEYTEVESGVSEEGFPARGVLLVPGLTSPTLAPTSARGRRCCAAARC
jgi:putative molybdopterin biosynthesis protein